MNARPWSSRWSALGLGLLGVTLALPLACDNEGGNKQAENNVPAAPKGTPAEGKEAGKEGTPMEGTQGGAITVKGFSAPESVIHDPNNDVYYVSNVAGTPIQKDDNGFISKVSPDGKMLEAKWIDGSKDDVHLDAPKGMAIMTDTLYVADIDRIRKFDVKTGAPKGEFAVPGATFLNGVVAGKGDTLYVSDSGTKSDAGGGTNAQSGGAIFRIQQDKPQVFAKGPDLQGPNGLAMNDAGLWAVTYQGNKLMRIGEDGKPTDVTELPKGSLDGLVITKDGRFLVSSWDGNAIYAGSPGKTFTAIVENVKSPAGIGYDAKRDRLLVPLFQSDVVELRPLQAAIDKHASR